MHTTVRPDDLSAALITRAVIAGAGGVVNLLELEFVITVRKADILKARAAVAQRAARGDRSIRVDDLIRRALPPVGAGVAQPQLVQRLAARALR